MKTILSFKALSILILLVFIESVFAAALPPPRLTGPDQRLVGQWVQIKAYCKSWSDKEIEQYSDTLKFNKYVEHLFVNLWDVKIIQSSVDPETARPPYAFCEREIYFRPLSYLGSVLFQGSEVVHETACQVPSVFEKTASDLRLYYQIVGSGGQELLKAFIDSWPGCGNGDGLIVFFRKR
ncbi:MAG: hypothetical protein KDD61_00835 [Bdellovibrionales bacterium]|nr:hypothetical protein [Bdellovibrionales bacterium]